MRPDADVEDALYDAAREIVGEAALATGPLVRAIVDRSRRYTSERDALSSPDDPLGDLAARAVFFSITDAPKLAVPFGELSGRGAVPARRPLRVVDLGAGCGAMSLGLIAAAGVELELTAIDQDTRALRIADHAVRAYAARRGVRVTITTRTADATEELPRADLVVMGTLLNELPAEVRIQVIERALEAIEDDGAVIVIEPALRATSRALHELRDHVVSTQRGHVFAPCTRTTAPCPALADPSDWCHEDRPIALPPRTAELARLTHLRDRGMKFSYLILRRRSLGLVATEGAWRIVGSPHAQKGKLELIGCSDAGRLPLRLLKRHRASINRELERAVRGDVVVISTTPGPDRVEVTRETTVDRHQPALPGSD